MQNYVDRTRYEHRHLCGPRIVAKLTGAAKLSVENKPPGWLNQPEGAHVLIDHLRSLGRSAVPELVKGIQNYFIKMGRSKGKSMEAYITRSESEHEKLRKACARVQKDKSKKKPDRRVLQP